MRTTYDVFNDTGGASLLEQRAGIEQLSTVLLKVSLWVGLGDAQALELANNADLSGFVLDDHVAWTSILLSGRSALDDGASLGLGSVRDPSLDDDIAWHGERTR